MSDVLGNLDISRRVWVPRVHRWKVVNRQAMTFRVRLVIP